jgi:spoIIIJ-associated protein
MPLGMAQENGIDMTESDTSDLDRPTDSDADLVVLETRQREEDDLEDDEREGDELDEGGSDRDGDDDAPAARSGNALLVQEGDIAADYLERLLDIVDYDGDIDLDVENGRAVVAIVGSDLSALVGAHGETLEALQELTRLAVQQKTGSRSRLMLDISNFRGDRRVTLEELARNTAEAVLAEKASVRLNPMNPFERKVVHDTISSFAGVRSESEGEEPNRRVVVLLAE